MNAKGGHFQVLATRSRVALVARVSLAGVREWSNRLALNWWRIVCFALKNGIVCQRRPKECVSPLIGVCLLAKTAKKNMQVVIRR